MARDNNFDLLRLLAALSVIFSHAFLLAENSQRHDPLMILTGGQTILGLVGVFVFFTISGFLISQSFAATASPLAFLAKRALRLFPGLIGCLLVCAFVIGPLVTCLPLAEYFAAPGAYLFLVHNAVLDVDYNRLPGVSFWAGNIGGIIDGPLWSLPCEALLYVLLFALGSCRLLKLAVLLPLLAAGIVCLWFDTANHGLFGTELPGKAGWLLGFFAAGMCAWRLPRPYLVDDRLALLALAGLVASVPLNLLLVAFPVFGGFLTLYLALTPRLPVVRAARFGDLSYGLYIYGWPIEQCVVHFSGGTAPWWTVFGIGVAAAVPTALLSWHGVEQHFRLRRRLPARHPAPVAALASD